MSVTILLIVWLASLLATETPARRAVGPHRVGPAPPPPLTPVGPTARVPQAQAPCHGHGKPTPGTHARRTRRGRVAIVR